MQEQTPRQRVEAITKAWKAGKRSVTLVYGGISMLFNLRKQEKEVVYQTGPQNAKEQHKRRDINIVATRADGGLVPRLNIKHTSKQLS